MGKNKINVTTKEKMIPWNVLLRLKRTCNKNNYSWKKEVLPPTEEEYESQFEKKPNTYTKKNLKMSIIKMKLESLPLCKQIQRYCT